jgi:hypothetical protein
VQGPAVLRRQGAAQLLSEVTVVQHMLEGTSITARSDSPRRLRPVPVPDRPRTRARTAPKITCCRSAGGLSERTFQEARAGLGARLGVACLCLLERRPTCAVAHPQCACGLPRSSGPWTIHRENGSVPCKLNSDETGAAGPGLRTATRAIAPATASVLRKGRT